MNSQFQLSPPKVSVHDGKVITTTDDVAAYFGKQPHHVVQKVESLDCSEDFTIRNFSRMVKNKSIGSGAEREVVFYEMTKDGFVFLVMGFTGKKAAAFKEAYIAEFNRMEEEIRQQKNDMIFGDSRTLVIHLDEHGNIKSSEKVPDGSVVCNVQSFKFWMERKGWLVIRRDDMAGLLNETLAKIGLPVTLPNDQ
ncbi:Rha family transcriptional regulator [Salmonella enterica]|nr:Rha family transcriptional regulator [Salmonella enterica]